MNDSLQEQWLKKLARLNPNRSKIKGAAPHKPCLLLALLDMAEDGELKVAEVLKTPGLHVRFNALAALAQERWQGRIDLTLPFYHLRSQGFWQTLDKDGNPTASADQTKVVSLDPHYLLLVQDPEFRRRARMLLVETYFAPAERLALYALMGVQPNAAEFIKEKNQLQEAAATYALAQGRSARFAVQVVCGYEHTCVFSGFRIITQEGASGVEAAHIEPWATSKNDDASNGLALSRTAHWAFDRGLWGVDDQYRIIVKKGAFIESGPSELCLTARHGRSLVFTTSSKLRPQQEYLHLHRQRWELTN